MSCLVLSCLVATYTTCLYRWIRRQTNGRRKEIKCKIKGRMLKVKLTTGHILFRSGLELPPQCIEVVKWCHEIGFGRVSIRQDLMKARNKGRFANREERGETLGREIHQAHWHFGRLEVDFLRLSKRVQEHLAGFWLLASLIIICLGSTAVYFNRSSLKNRSTLICWLFLLNFDASWPVQQPVIESALNLHPTTDWNSNSSVTLMEFKQIKQLSCARTEAGKTGAAGMLAYELTSKRTKGSLLRKSILLLSCLTWTDS